MIFVFENITRIVDDEGDANYWIRIAYNSDGSYNGNVTMNQIADADWHIFRIFRQSPGTAGFQIDDNPVETVDEHVPSINMPPYIDSYGVDNNVIVDWFRIRKWAGSDPVTIVGPGLLNGQNLRRRGPEPSLPTGIQQITGIQTVCQGQRITFQFLTLQMIP